MTRETKIGLLVGLAFIIVIGILLSDHINASGEPVRAETTGIFNSVEKGVNAPNSRQPGATDVVIAPQQVVPQSRVLTQTDSEPRQNSGNTIIQISPGGDPSKLSIPPRINSVAGSTIPQEGSAQAPPPVVNPEQNQVASNDGQSNAAAAAAPTDNLSNVAQSHSEPIVNLNGSPVGISTGPVRPIPQASPRQDVRQVTAEENDTVSKFALKYMGANTKANRAAIIAANPSVGPDGSKVFSGRSYVIPVASGASQATAPGASAVAQAPQPARQPVAQSAPAPAPAAPASTMYTVKENDTLWKIASEQLGSGVRYTEIEELNRDVLKGNAQLRPNMRLKMPAKAVASNN